MNARRARELAEMIRKHGFTAHVVGGDAKGLRVESPWTRGDERGVDVEVIPATRQAVRDWLGY